MCTIKNQIENTNYKDKFEYLKKQGNSYKFSVKIPFDKSPALKKKTVEEVFEFSYKMAYSPEAYQRNCRSGGTIERTNGQIFANTFQGKIAECGACNYFHQFDTSVYPDFSVEGKGIWDSVDLTVKGTEIAIKSTKDYGQLLLLEQKDWNEKGWYIPNIGKRIYKYDYVALVRVHPNSEQIMKNHKLLYSEEAEKDFLREVFLEKNWTYDYMGYITYDELVYIINNKYILPKGSLLNERTLMDADNYYVQGKDMHQLSELKL